MKNEVVYSAQDVADILKIKKSTVYNMIKRGELAAYRIGHQVRISDLEVESYKKRALNVYTEQRILESQNFAQQEPAQPVLIDEPAPRTNGFIICGQDSALDTLANQLQSLSVEAISPLRSYVGSYNGLYMLYQEQVSIASAHLWDGKTDTYNIPYVERMLPGVSAVVIHLFKRMQGFYVQSGNPQKISSWEDLKRQDLTFVNREKGSGTRVLLDERLRLMGVDPAGLPGYRRECFSHLAVAGVVARGGADFGLGTRSSVKLLAGLEYIPLQQESYDLVIKKEDINKRAYRAAVDTVRSNEFRMALEGMDEYDLTGLGNIIAET